AHAIITAVLNPRAKTGKTTTAVNLTAALVRSRRRALLVDLDPQGHATSHLGVRPSPSTKTTQDLFAHQKLCPEAVLRSIEQDLFLVPSSLGLTAVERDLGRHAGHELILRQRLDALRRHFGNIVLDCPPGLGLLSLNALCAADEIIVPVSADDFAFQ